MIDPRSVAVRFSNLKKMALSPANYLAAINEEHVDSRSKKMGRLVHAVILGTEMVVYEGQRRGKAWKAFAAEHAGKEIGTRTEADLAGKMAASITKSPRAMQLLDGERESLILWEQQGRECQSRPDVIGKGFLTEFKTARCTEPGWFIREARRRAYNAQLSFYADAVRTIDPRVNAAFIVAVENISPFNVTTFELSPRSLEDGRKCCRLWFERLLACERSNEWPGYAQTTVTIDNEMVEDPELVFEDDEAA